MLNKSFYKELVDTIRERNLSKSDISKLKVKLCKKYGVKELPTDIEVLFASKNKDMGEIKLQTKPGRTASGVAVIAIMSHPYKCPHGKCSMCPSNVKKGIPQSYTGAEPATMRGARNNYDPYLQVMNRLEQYALLGQNFDKIELIIMGGTFPSFPKKYQEEFVTYSLKALNDFSELFMKKKIVMHERFKKFFLLPGKVGDETRTKQIQQKLLKLKGKSALLTEQERNEKSQIRCVGMTFESRPDYGGLKEGNYMLKLGATRVELGVQSVYDSALKRIERGHSVKQTIKSIKILKDLGFKLNFHYMPGLPGINHKKDLEGMKKLFSDPNFRPDMLKIYPCMVIPGTKLYKEYKAGKFKPMTTQKAVELIAEFKKHIPTYCRVMRVQRDIPTNKTTAGVDKTNLRQMIDQKKHGCRCIRCREAGHVLSKKGILPDKIKILVNKYEASEGKEFFISAEDTKNDILLGFCRLRFPAEQLRKEITPDCALIRELHVYGEAILIGDKGLTQHSGWGKKLLSKAEEISKKNKKKKVVIISGIGVRPYYQKLGYKKEGPYMVKFF